MSYRQRGKSYSVYPISCPVSSKKILFFVIFQNKTVLLQSTIVKKSKKWNLDLVPRFSGINYQMKT